MSRARIVLLVLLVALLVFASRIAYWYTELLWYAEVGYLQAYWVPVLSRIVLWAIGAAAVFVILYLNARPLLGLRRDERVIDLETTSRGGRRLARRVPQIGPGTIVTWAIAAVAALAGLALAARWDLVQRFLHAQSFGVSDPIFGRDIGFYVFTLPIYRLVTGWLFGWLLVALLVVLVGYYLDLAPLLMRGVWTIPARARTHLSVLAGLLLAVRGWGLLLDRYDLLYSPLGTVYGVGWTDHHARLPALTVVAAATFAAAGLLFLNARLRTLRLAVLTIVGTIVIWFLGLSLYPGVVQQYVVAPNELTRETPYLANAIAGSRAAFGLDAIREESFPAGVRLTAEAARRNRATLENTRVWDYRPLLTTFNQIQSLRQYYSFADVDLDRYPVQGLQRQVMLSAREMNIDRLPEPARTWVNEHLVYTHGYGVVMIPVNRISEEGLPEFFVRDIPPVSPVGIRIENPAIYYGELTDQYVITNARTQELDYPRGDENVYTTYAGRGGIPIGHMLRRLAFAIRFGTSKIALSADIGAQSRVLFHRQIRERVSRIAPFLALDGDPYPVVADGRIVWILDAYTTTDRYPYSTPLDPESGTNYIRNSVKVVVDAYDGSVAFYLWDERDPIARSLGGIFPGLFRPKSAFPASLLRHVRYPEGLFRAQARAFEAFHMRDPRVFYNREDVWAYPNEIFGNQTVQMEPYYVTLRLQRDERPEFVLILPFTPAGRDNMIAWMAARNDPERYGEVVVYRFPKQEIVFGPMQVESRINQDPVISAQLTLWNQEGSQVIRGNLIVVPVEQSLLYVEPIYLQATTGQLPELKRVIVVHGARVIMEDTFDAALAKVLGTEVAPQPAQPTGELSAEAKGLIRQAGESYRRAQELLRSGDLGGFDREIKRLGEIIKRLQQAAGQ